MSTLENVKALQELIQREVDAATNPLHVEIGRLKAELDGMRECANLWENSSREHCRKIEKLKAELAASEKAYFKLKSDVQAGITVLAAKYAEIEILQGEKAILAMENQALHERAEKCEKALESKRLEVDSQGRAAGHANLLALAAAMREGKHWCNQQLADALEFLVNRR